MQFYISVMFLGLPDDIHEEKPSFLEFKKNALPTDGPTNGRTDRPSYMDATTHLKINTKSLIFWNTLIWPESAKNGVIDVFCTKALDE